MSDDTGTKLVETIARLTARIAELETEGERRAEEIHKANVWIREGGERISELESELAQSKADGKQWLTDSVVLTASFNNEVDELRQRIAELEGALTFELHESQRDDRVNFRESTSGRTDRLLRALSPQGEKP